MYVIIKSIKCRQNGKMLPVIILTSSDEIWEFDTEQEAEKMKEIFQNNSDSGHIYSVKKI